LSALSSGDLLASIPEALIEGIAAFLRPGEPPYGAGSPTTEGFPWPAVDQQEWILRRAKAAQVRSWSGMVHAAITTLPDNDDDVGNDDGDGVPERAVKQVADRMAVDFTQTPQQTTSDLRAAVALVDHLPRIFVLFHQGRLDWTRARLIALRLLNPPSTLTEFTPGGPQWRFIEAALAAQAPSLARPRLERLIARLLLELAPGTAHEAALTGRRVWTDPLPDGMAFFGAILSADAAQYVMGVLEAMADACRDQASANGTPDPRTHQQRCADALTAIFTVLGEGGDIPIVPTPSNPDSGPDPEPGSAQDPGVAPDPVSAPDPGVAPDPDSAPSSGSDPAPNTSSGSGSGTGTGTGTGPNTGPSTGSAPDSATNTNTGPDSGSGPGTAAASDVDSVPGPDPTDLLDESLNEQEASGRREQELFGIGPFPCPEDFTTPTTKNGSLVPAWWRFRELPRRKGHGPHLTITSTDATWLGLASTPALLHGYGAISAEQARKLGARPDQITILVFPTACSHPPETHQSPTRPEQPKRPGSTSPGTPGDPEDALGDGPKCAYRQDHTAEQATRYRPSRSLTDLITAIFSTCTFPQCNRPAIRCDVDHLQPFGKGGASCICNLHPACRRHHQLKTSGQWQARPSRPDEPYPAGTIIWTTPDGHPHPSTPCLPGRLGWAPDQPVDSQALRQALDAREALLAMKNQAEQGGSTPPSLTREDTMPNAERSRLRQERWQKDVQRHTKNSPRHNNQTSHETQPRPESPTRRDSTPTRSPNLSRPSVIGQHHQNEEPPF
jgi:hypothetical protein